MHGSEHKDGMHSTPIDDPRPKLWPRFLGSIAIVGLMVGLMIGRLTTPDPIELQRIETLPDGVAVWFNREPQLHGEIIDGAVALLFNAQGTAQRGELKLANGRDVRWKVQKSDKGLLLNLLAARPLRGEWRGATEDGRWRLQVSLREE
ncbi:hypothetical protein [Pseudomonas sp. LS-2]|uniref:hypothetical protein n=1 Tax=Pseudomonas sp. LS-2 TaxID=2315859 RepID=UPI000E769483|nr:hypothetical protein [Pseudomonas sp. LS-2]RJX76272.1 hypothetical protein D3M70_23265 [Pseudomonas sp. LS-2]